MHGAIVLIVGVVAVALGWFIIGYLASFVGHHVSVWFIGFQERRKKAARSAENPNSVI